MLPSVASPPSADPANPAPPDWTQEPSKSAIKVQSEWNQLFHVAIRQRPPQEGANPAFCLGVQPDCKVQSQPDSRTCPIPPRRPESAIATHEHCAWSWTLIGTAIARLARQVSDPRHRG